MKILVTGGCGFIGFHTVNELLNNGHEVVVFDNMSTGKMENFTDLMAIHSHDGKHCRAQLVIGDVTTDHEELLSAMNGCDSVIHLAAVVSVTDSIENPWKSFNINSSGFMNVLNMARCLKIKKFIYASSAAVYGNSSSTSEEIASWNTPTSPYGADKLLNDTYANVFKNLYDMKPVGLRYFNVYGPRQDPKSPYAGVIAKFINWIKNNEPFTIYGDGEQVRSFIHVNDIAKINVLAATKIDHATVYNIANPVNTEISLNALIVILESILNIKIKRNHLPSRSGEIKHSSADLKLLNTLQLPEFTDLKTGLSLMLAEEQQ